MEVLASQVAQIPPSRIFGLSAASEDKPRNDSGRRSSAIELAVDTRPRIFSPAHCLLSVVLPTPAFR